MSFFLQARVVPHSTDIIYLVQKSDINEIKVQDIHLCYIWICIKLDMNICECVSVRYELDLCGKSYLPGE